MIAERVATQAEVDEALAKKFGIHPTGQYTTDKTQQLYENSEGKGFILPSSNQGYSYYSVSDILAHIQQISSGANVVSIHHYTTADSPDKTDLKLVEPED